LIECAEIDVYSHSEEWNIDLAIGGKVVTYPGADEVIWWLTADAIDRQGEVTRHHSRGSGPCPQDSW
jgi:hypothetical protein